MTQQNPTQPSQPPQSSGDANVAIRQGRRTWRRIGLVLLLVLLIPYLTSRLLAPSRAVRVFQPEPPVPTTGPIRGKLRIIGFNIAHGRGQAAGNWSENAAPKRTRIEAIASQLKTLDADVVVLNEVDFYSSWSGHQNQAARIAELASYPYRVEQRNLDLGFVWGGFQFGNTILSRFPIVGSPELLDYPPEKIWEAWLAGKKRGVLATLDLGDHAKEIQIAAVHFPHRTETARVQAAGTLLESLQPPGQQAPLIAIGDFNSSPQGFPGHQTTANRENAMDKLLASGRFQVEPTEFVGDAQLTFSTMGPQRVIDWALLSTDQPQAPHHGWTLSQVQVLQTELSDHAILVADLDYSRPEPSE